MQDVMSNQILRRFWLQYALKSTVRMTDIQWFFELAALTGFYVSLFEQRYSWSFFPALVSKSLTEDVYRNKATSIVERPHRQFASAMRTTPEWLRQCLLVRNSNDNHDLQTQY
jgi:hypothetical protein